MFRKATDGAGKPCYMLVCDNPKCDVVARGEIREEMIDSTEVKLGFINAVRQDGWSVDIEAQFCPKHSQAQAKRLIQVARAIPGIVRN